MAQSVWFRVLEPRYKEVHGDGNADTTPISAIDRRWVQFGMLSSHSTVHGSTTYPVPWLMDEATEVLRRFTMLKN